MNVKASGATRRMSRLVRWLARRNALRRPVDRIEGAVLVALSTAFLVAVAVAPILGTHTYQSQRADNPSLTRSSQRQTPGATLRRYGRRFMAGA
jgi:hypothetical protein